MSSSNTKNGNNNDNSFDTVDLKMNKSTQVKPIIEEQVNFNNPNQYNDKLDWSNVPGFNTWRKGQFEEEIAKYNSGSKMEDTPTEGAKGGDVVDNIGIKRQLSQKSDKSTLKNLNEVKAYLKVIVFFICM